MNGLSAEGLALNGAVLLAVGYGVLGALWLIPATRAIARDLARVFFSATIVAVVLIAALLAGTAGLVLLMVAVSLRVGYEAGHVRLGAGRPAWGMAIVAFGVTAAAMAEPLAAVALAGVWPLLLLRALMARGGGTGRGLLDLLVFPVIPMALLAHGLTAPEWRIASAGAYALVEIFDSCALLAGKLFGRRKAFPVLSPGKTVEGLIGGGLGLLALSAGGAVLLGLDGGALILTASLVAGLAVAGDLAASRLKRMAGVKDYPVLMRRQGGVLDSLDSWIAAGAGLVALNIILTWL